MATATVGSLRVVLGADTAAFSKGLQQSEQKLSGFAKAAKMAGPIIATALAGAAVALGVAIKRTIDDADELAKTSQKIGIPVEELSRLRHAAELSGIEFNSMTTALGRLSRNMSDVAAGSGAEARRAFEQLGIEVKNADGSLKSSTEVMQEVAGRFANMQDGAAKTALSMQLFGRAGADLIPLLNQGAEGIQKLKDEADELGIVISTEAAKAAEQFNDNLDRMSKLGQGLVIGIVNEWTPALADLSEVTLSAAKGMKELSGELGALIGQEAAAETFFDKIEGAILRTLNPIGAAITGYRTLKKLAAESAEGGGLPELDFEKMREDLGLTAAAFNPLIVNNKAAADAARELAEAQRAQNAIQQEAQALLVSIQTPAQQYQAELDKINKLHQLGAIDSEQYQQALAAAAENAGATWGQASQSIAGSFADVTSAFGRESKTMAKAAKAFGAVQAVISMWQGAAHALTLPWPANLAAAASVIAKGLAFVANIRSQQVPSFAHGGSFMVGGVGGVDNNRVVMDLSRGERVDITPADEARGGHRTISVSGIDPAKFYTGTQLRELMTNMVEAQRDGFKFVPGR